MDMEQHLNIAAVVRIGFAVLGLIVAAMIFVFVVGGGWISGDPDAIRITGIVGTAIAGFLTIVSLPGIIAGIGLYKRWQWARWLTLVLAVLDLVNVPVGTLVGIYTIWVLAQDEVAKLFE